MKQTVNFTMFCDAFTSYDRHESFTYEGKKALFEYLEQYEEDCGEEVELDVIALCCEYTEYDNAIEAASQYGEEYKNENDALEYLRYNTQIIEFETGIIIQNF